MFPAVIFAKLLCGMKIFPEGQLIGQSSNQSVDGHL
jgi:hypothetical protein